MTNVGPSTSFSKTPLPSQYAAVPVASQPPSDINQQYNYLVRTVKELWACIEGAPAGTDINNTTLTDYSAAANLGILPRLVAVEQQGKIQDSAYVQIGTNLNAASRGVRFTLGSVNLYSELFYDNDNGGIFKLRNQAGGLLRLQAALPTVANDVATKQYVDSLSGAGVLKKHCDVAAPVYVNTTSFSIEYAHAADSLGTTFMSKSTSTTVSLSNTGLNGLASSSQSLGINGTITVTNSTNTVTGSGTSFQTDFVVGDWIVTNGLQARQITGISSQTAMTVGTNWSSTETGVAYSRGGVRPGSSMSLNLYMVADSAALNIGFILSTRNTLLGQTLVDFPRVGKTGSVAVANGSPDINGTGTSFTTEFSVGQTIYIISGSTVYNTTVSEIVSNTLMKASGNWGVSFTGGTIGVVLNKYRQLPFAGMTDGSGNQMTYVVHGFPWNTCVELLGYDGSSRYSPVAGSTTASASSINLVTNGFVPQLCRKVGGIVYATMVAQTSAPATFQVAPSSAQLGSYFNVMTMIQQWNSLGNFSIVTNNQFVELPLDSNNALWYKSSSTNAQGGFGITKFYMTEWRG